MFIHRPSKSRGFLLGTYQFKRNYILIYKFKKLLVNYLVWRLKIVFFTIDSSEIPRYFTSSLNSCHKDYRFATGTLIFFLANCAKRNKPSSCLEFLS
jgi:hypothetical protein